MYSKASDNTSRTKLVQCSCRSCGTNLNQETLFREGTEISASLSNRFICGVRFLTTMVQLPQWCSVRLICSTVRFENTLEVGCAVIFLFSLVPCGPAGATSPPCQQPPRAASPPLVCMCRTACDNWVGPRRVGCRASSSLARMQQY